MENLQTIINSQINSLKNCLDELGTIQKVLLTPQFFNEKFMVKGTFSTSDENKEFYNDLRRTNQPILYWFSFDPKYKQEIWSAFKDFKNTNGQRVCSYLAAKQSTTKNTLYVGKVKKNFSYRFVTHLGYSENKQTVGLQLFHWYKRENHGDLELHYIVLNKEMGTLIGGLEIELASKLKPLIGSHKN